MTMTYENTALQKSHTINDPQGRIAQLEKIVLEKNQVGEALQESEKRYRRLFESAKDGILILDAESGRVVDVNPFLLQLLGYDYDALIGKHLWEIGVFKDIAASKDAFKILQDHEYIRYEDLPLQSQDGHSIAVEFVSNVYLVDHVKVIQCNIRDITARKQAEAERNRLMAAIDQTGDAIVVTDAQGIIQFVNPAYLRTTGNLRHDVLGQRMPIFISNEQNEGYFQKIWDTVSSGSVWFGRVISKRRNGTPYTEEMTISPVRDGAGVITNFVAVKRDITENLNLEAQLHQSQKLEAVGLLAGGMAHDYNNMLSVIISYAELALCKTDPGNSVYSDIEEILKAAKRSTEVTRHLLTFARKQIIVPIMLNLNQTVENMLNMLRRLIGENIELTWRPTVGPCLIRMDSVQIDQILVNLCVNAKAAIADIGKIMIKTRNVVFDKAYCDNHTGFTEGRYVLLAVSDNGCGIDPQIIDRIFEPFFTNKDVGHGTGLGLATVYGIVKQNNGFINITTKPGQGTTFSIYLPQYTGLAPNATQNGLEEIPRGNGEYVLVVEDEPAILKVGKLMLEKLGYHVLAAATPGEAILLAEQHASEIRLLIIDVIMPEMNGWDLAKQLKSRFPNFKVLFMSGYTANVITGRSGVLKEGVSFIQKPFSMKGLAVKLRDILNDNQGIQTPANGSAGEWAFNATS